MAIGNPMEKSITKKNIIQAFTKAETTLEFCWGLLVDLKENSITENDFTIRFITFQEKLAGTVFNLQSLRDKIIKEEKKYIKNKNQYNLEWFKAKMRQLSDFKKGIDYVVNISKAIGDAYAYFFYQNDLELLAEHLSHQRIVNHTAGNGERGELEFTKNIKHIEGQFTLFHGITNILRYGDFSFIDLISLRVTQIGELKTKWVAENILETSITLFRKKEGAKSDNKPIRNHEMEKNRVGRQQLGIANFLKGRNDDNTVDNLLIDKSYADEIGLLLKNSKINNVNSIQASPGLAFTCLRFKRTSLYNHLFKRKTKSIVDRSANGIKDITLKLVKPDTKGNAIVLGQLLYNPDFTDKNTPGTVPIFWHPIDNKLLRDLYFGQSVVMSIFNPVHLIHDVEKSGFLVESEYYKSESNERSGKKGVIKHFDLFISYIINHLLTENFVIGMLAKIEESTVWGKVANIQVKPQQHVEFFKRRSKPKQ